MFKDYFQAPVAALVHADYRLDGRNTLMCVTSEGDVRGWLPSSTGGDASGSTHIGEGQGDTGNEAYRELMTKKQKLNISLKSNKVHGTVELNLMTSNYSVIRAVVIF